MGGTIVIADLTLRCRAGGAEMAHAYRKNSDTTETVVGKLNVLILDKTTKKCIWCL